MKNYLKIFFCIIFIAALTTIPAQAVTTIPPTYFNYAHDEAEYSVALPEAPTVKTIWAGSSDASAYIENPPNEGPSLGEIATFKRVDVDTEESFEVKITFLKARKTFLEGLTTERIHDMLKKQYTGVQLSNEAFKISKGTETLKWATLSGFTLDSHQHPAFYAINYLTGLQSVLVVEVTYSIENKTFQEYYDNVINSITYNAP